MASPTPPVLLVGPPRSGSTWTSRVLSTAAGVEVVHEPDNAVVDPYAWLAKAGHGRLPVLDEDATPPRRYELLWAGALAGGGPPPADGRRYLAHRLHQPVKQAASNRRPGLARAPVQARLALASLLARPRQPVPDARTVIVKSVYAACALPWLTRRFDVRVVVQRKSPLNFAASFSRRGWPPPLEHALRVAHPGAIGERLARWLPAEVVPTAPGREVDYHVRMGWQVGAYLTVLHRQAEANPDWIVSQHEDVTDDPSTRFRALFDALDLEWTDETTAYLAASDTEDTATYGEQRVAAAEADKWRRLLGEGEAARVREGFAPFEPVLGPPEGASPHHE